MEVGSVNVVLGRALLAEYPPMISRVAHGFSTEKLGSTVGEQKETTGNKSVTDDRNDDLPLNNKDDMTANTAGDRTSRCS